MTKKEFSEADELNKIESRIRQHKKVSQREINLLLEGYSVFHISVPRDIKRLIR